MGGVNEERMRRPGFYWVRLATGPWVVAEWVLASVEEWRGVWRPFGGINHECENEQLTEIDERRIVRPED